MELTAAWTYTSGNRMTLSLESYEQAGTLTISNQYKMNNWWEPSGEVVDLYTRRNNYQMPAYHRLDLGLNIYRPEEGRGEWASGISVFIMYIAG